LCLHYNRMYNVNLFPRYLLAWDFLTKALHHWRPSLMELFF
jgi:hypothetical protein